MARIITIFLLLQSVCSNDMRWFRRVDSNRDGGLTSAELVSYFASLTADRNFLTEVDTDEDLSVSIDEAAAFVNFNERDFDNELNFAEFFHRDVLSLSERLEEFEWADRDRNGWLSRYEFAGYLDLPDFDVEVIHTFRMLDTIKEDQRLTFKEFSGEPWLDDRWFDAIDFNRDGLIVRSEFDTYIRSRPDPSLVDEMLIEVNDVVDDATIRRFWHKMDKNDNTQVTFGEFVSYSRPESELRSQFQHFDVELPSSKLSLSEMAELLHLTTVDKEVSVWMERLDEDEDQFVSFQELNGQKKSQEWSGTPAELLMVFEVFLQPTSRATRPPMSALVNTFDDLVARLNVLNFAASFPLADLDKSGDFSVQEVANFDLDQDNHVGLTELRVGLMGSTLLMDEFSLVDGNNDDIVELKELTVFLGPATPAATVQHIFNSMLLDAPQDFVDFEGYVTGRRCLAENNKPCVFPFVLRYQSHHACTDVLRFKGDFWCATEVDDNNRVTQNHTCKSACNSASMIVSCCDKLHVLAGPQLSSLAGHYVYFSQMQPLLSPYFVSVMTADKMFLWHDMDSYRWMIGGDPSKVASARARSQVHFDKDSPLTAAAGQWERLDASGNWIVDASIVVQCRPSMYSVH